MDKYLMNFKEDIFDRRNLAVNLTKVIENSPDINVVAIDSSWGTGKTTFVRMWQNMLSSEDEYKNSFETLYFNSWENDYIKNPGGGYFLTEPYMNFS